MGARNIPGVACLEHVSRGGCGHRFKVYPIAEPLTPLGPPIDRIMPPPFVAVVRAQLGTLLLDGSVTDSCALTPWWKGAHASRTIARKALVGTHRTNFIDSR